MENVDQDADNPVFNKYTDLYAMAYHIFALLMNGSSPFASMANMEEISQHPSKNVSSIDIDPFHAAEKGEFVFARHFLFQKAPDYALKYKMLSMDYGRYLNELLLEGQGSKPFDQMPWNFIMRLQNISIFKNVNVGTICLRITRENVSGQNKSCRRLNKLYYDET